MSARCGSSSRSTTSRSVIDSPSASSRLRENVSSAAGLNSVTRPCASSPMMHSKAAFTIALLRASLARTSRSASRWRMNCPTRLPMPVSSAISSSSGSRTRELKNSITPVTSPCAVTGSASAAWMSSRAAWAERSWPGCTPTSGTHSGMPPSQTLPGSPSPGANAA